MPKVITLMIDDDIAVSNEDLKTLFRDALGEFVSHREPAHEYVKRRYERSIADAGWKVRKVKEVQDRCLIATILKLAVSGLEVSIVTAPQ